MSANILNPDWKYTKAVATDIRKTFARERKRLEAEAKAKAENEAEAVKVVSKRKIGAR
jgi:hypothetical protein